MHWNGIPGQWAQFKGRLKEQWGALTGNELEAITGSREQLIGKLQEKHGLTKDEAERYH
ncbi:MAG TPA: CsbD family protein [Candidatus Tectomicrobia bacterium]|nr:CsbD family protein [Candidatus Tectomicrobia bacterium]